MNARRSRANLIVHCDDLGMAQSINRATFHALDKNIASSASAMVPCPWFPEVVEKSLANPSWDLGIHLTLTSEWKACRWSPVAIKSQVHTLIDPHGYFWSDVGRMVTAAHPDHVRREFDAQLDKALRMGMRPTHVDCHMFAAFQTPDLFGAYVRVARDHHLPYFYARRQPLAFENAELLIGKDIVLDDFRMATESWKPQQWSSSYEACVATLTSGINQLTIHAGYDDHELRALAGKDDHWGSAWRQRDLEAISGVAFRAAVERANLELCSWRDIASRASVA